MVDGVDTVFFGVEHGGGDQMNYREICRELYRWPPQSGGRIEYKHFKPAEKYAVKFAFRTLNFQ